MKSTALSNKTSIAKVESVERQTRSNVGSLAIAESIESSLRFV
jgi:hypothetical protein